MTEKNPEPLRLEDITENVTQTLWRWSIRNGWAFIPDPDGSDALIDPRLAWQLGAPHNAYSSCKNGLLRGLPRTRGLVRLSDLRGATDE